jgi:hypothetical protein
MTEAEKARLRVELRRRQAAQTEQPVAQTEQPVAEPVAPKSFGQTLKENLLGDDDPTTQNFGEKVGTFLNKTGESMTYGLVGDDASARVAAAIPGGMDYDQRLQFERQQEKLLEESNPGVALTADLTGAVIGALGPGGAIGTLGRGASIGSRALASGAAGAGMGATYGFMEGEGLDDRLNQAVTGAGWGAAGGLAAPLVGGAVQRIADGVVGSRAIKSAAANAPDSQTLRAIGSQLYDEVDNAGVQVKGEAFNDARQKILDELTGKTAYTPRPGGRTITPNTSAVVGNMADMADEMAGAQSSGLPFKEIDSLRRQAGSAAGNVANKSDQQAGMTLIEGLDDFVENLGPNDVVAGDVKALQSALPKARETWAKMSKSQLLDDAISQQDNYLSGGASAIRNRFASLLRNPKTAKSFTEAEKKAMQRVISGSIPQQLLNYMGSGLGMMGQMGLGAATGGPLGLAAGMAGAAASRKASSAMTQRNAEIARALVASGRLNQLPVASDGYRKITEALMRRGGAAGPQ